MWYETGQRGGNEARLDHSIVVPPQRLAPAWGCTQGHGVFPPKTGSVKMPCFIAFTGIFTGRDTRIPTGKALAQHPARHAAARRQVAQAGMAMIRHLPRAATAGAVLLRGQVARHQRIGAARQHGQHHNGGQQAGYGAPSIRARSGGCATAPIPRLPCHRAGGTSR